MFVDGKVASLRFLVTSVLNPVAEGQLLCMSDGELRFCLVENNGNFWQLCSKSCWEQMIWLMITCMGSVKRWGELWLCLLLYRAMTKHQMWDCEKCQCRLEVMSCISRMQLEGARAMEPLQGEQMSSSFFHIDAALFLTKMPKMLKRLIRDL